MQEILADEKGLAACKEIVEKILAGKITNQAVLEKEKTKVSGIYSLEKLLKNADIISYCEMTGNSLPRITKLLMTKPVRTLSGVANIAVMWLGEDNFSCPFSCIYCPAAVQTDSSGTKMFVPKSYIGVEPTSLRAMRNRYDPYMQVGNRLKQLQLIGHPTDKCELIIMGGTYLAWGRSNYEHFAQRCYDAFNGCSSGSLEEAKRLNETAANRVIGLTVETRADYCREYHIREMLQLGATRVELGVQTTDDNLLKLARRGHGAEENRKAFRLLREAGLKITAHWMPGLTGLRGKIDMEKEVETFRELFNSPDYRPDELKIYPTLVIAGTGLYDLWRSGEYEALTFEQTLKLLAEMKKHVPKYVRIKRIMRDISEHEAQAGARTTNLRQLLQERMKKESLRCNCIRCREVGSKVPENIELAVSDYEASGGREFFISFEDANLLVAFLRLRIDSSGIAKVRELHVYGPQIPIGKSEAGFQHLGYGRKLMEKAEAIAKEFSKSTIAVTSGVGAREYYKKLGYKLEGFYMAKDLYNSYD